MRTPKEYTEKIKDRVITVQMLVDCLYSSNKRAKNYRDKEREYRAYFRCHRYAYDKYGNIEKMRGRKQEYYAQKEKLLSVLEPKCIHRECYGYQRQRIYDYEPEYRKRRKDFVWENCYYDDGFGRHVYFGDVEDHSAPLYHFYYFYDIGGGHTFHSPISAEEAGSSRLEVVAIDTLQTEGRDIADLVSNQFVKKVIAVIESGDYTFKE